MKSIYTRWRKLLTIFKDKDAREAFVSSRVAAAVAIRIFNLRKKKGWTQAQLAEHAKMKQARISVLEQADYENFSFSTLRRVAAAFDVAVVVDFVSFRDFLKWSDSFSSETLVPESFDDSEQALEVEQTNEMYAAILGELFGKQNNDAQTDNGQAAFLKSTSVKLNRTDESLKRLIPANANM